MEHQRQAHVPHRGDTPPQPLVRQVALELLPRLVQLLPHHRLIRPLAPLQVLHLDDVPVPDVRVLRHEGLQVQVRIALVQLTLGVDDELAHHAEVRRQERLHHLLPVEVVANPRLLRDGRRDVLDRRAPFAPVGHSPDQPREVVVAHREHPHVPVRPAEIPVHQPPHRLVRNAQPGRPPRHPADAQQPEVVQQRQEVLRLVEFIQRKAQADVGLRLPLADEVAQQVEVAVEPPRARAHPLIHQQQVAQLRVVDANVGVDEVVRHRLVREGALQVVEHHVGVVEVAGGGLGEAVAVVPLTHHVESRIHVLAERAALPVELQKAVHLRLGEAEHPVELRLQGDVAPDVEAAGDVVHGDGRDAGDEQPFEAAARLAGPGLQGGEEVAVEAPAVGEGLVGLPPPVHQHRVGEVVVLVDEHVERDAVLAGVFEQRGELAVDGGWSEDALKRRLGEQVRMPFQRVAQHDEAVALEALLQGLQLVVEGGEIEAHHDVAPALGGGRAPDVGAAEQIIELVRPVAPVIALQERQPAGLAEAPGTDEEGVALVFQRAQVSGLVHVQPAVHPDAPERHLAVGDTRVWGGCWNGHVALRVHEAGFIAAPPLARAVRADCTSRSPRRSPAPPGTAGAGSAARSRSRPGRGRSRG